VSSLHSFTRKLTVRVSDRWIFVIHVEKIYVAYQQCDKSFLLPTVSRDCCGAFSALVRVFDVFFSETVINSVVVCVGVVVYSAD